MVDNNVGMRYGGTFLESNTNKTFDAPFSGLQKTKYNKGFIYCDDAFKLVNINKGHVGISLQFTYDIINGVYSKINGTPIEYLLWGINVGKSNIAIPSICAKLTKDGIKFTISSGFGQYSIIDNGTNISSGEMTYFEFIWDSERIYQSPYDYSIGIPDNLIDNSSSMPSEDFWATMSIKINDFTTVIGNPPISYTDSLSGLNFCVLDTADGYNNLECIIGNLFVANGFIEEGNEESYESSSSSSKHSLSSQSSSSYSSQSHSSKSSQSSSSSSSKSSQSSSSSSSTSSSSSSTQNKWTYTNVISNFIPLSMASSNNNSYIYVVGTSNASSLSTCSAKIYKSIDKTSFADITSNIVSSTGLSTGSGTRCYEIKCNYSGQNLLLGLQGSHYSNTASVLYSNNYGSSWLEVVSNVYAPTGDYDNGSSNSLCISPVSGQYCVVHAGDFRPYSKGYDRVYINTNYGSGSWDLFNTPPASIPVAAGDGSIFINDNGEISYMYKTSVAGGAWTVCSLSWDLGKTWMSTPLMIDNAYGEYARTAGTSNDMYHFIVGGDFSGYGYGFEMQNSDALSSPFAHTVWWGSNNCKLICNLTCDIAYGVNSNITGSYPLLGEKSIKGTRTNSGWIFSRFTLPNPISITSPRCLSGANDLSHVCMADVISVGNCQIYLR